MGHLFLWRMVRDSNPRKGCPFNGFQDRRIRPLCQPSETVFLFRSTAHIVHYFLRIANTKIISPAKNITPDNNCPIVSPHDVKNPIWASGARYSSQNIRNTAYPMPIIPPNAPACRRNPVCRYRQYIMMNSNTPSVIASYSGLG